VKKTKIIKALPSVLAPAIFGAAAVILWQTQIIHRVANLDTVILPLPTRIIEIIAGDAGAFWHQASSTITVAVFGLAAGSALGFAVALTASLGGRFGLGGLTVVSAFNAVPLVALAPVVNSWTRGMSPDVSVRSTAAKIIVVMITCTVAMSVNAYRGLTDVKPFSEDLLKSYAAGKTAVFIKLRLPNCVPYIFTALRISVPASVIGALVSEYFAEETVGVGRQIRENIVKGQYPTAWSYILVACAIGIAFYLALVLAESRLTRHRKV
jgi:NitT/TauT family transport system permease protein